MSELNSRWVAYLGTQPMAIFSSYHAALKWTEQFGNKFDIRESV